MAITDFSVNKLRFWAVVSGLEIELTNIELNYALNSIPTATLGCAIGREVRSLLAASIHYVIDDLRVNLPVIVYCEAQEVDNSGITGGEFPVGPFVVFDGRVVGVGYQKSRSGVASLRLTCRNFLMDLEYALTNTKTTHPKNMGAGGMNCGIKIAGGSPDFVIQSTAKESFTSANILEDYWGSALRPWLVQVIALPAVFEGEDISEGQGAVDADNALARIEPRRDAGFEYTFGTEIPLDPFDVLNFSSAIQSIANNAAQSTFQSFTGTTIWEKIVQEFASNMLFALAPMADRARIITFIPGLRETWITIDPSEYETISLESHLPRALRGVVVYTGMGSMTGAFGFQRGQAGAIRTVGGTYENEDIESGMFVFREGPLWMNNAVSAPFWAAPALGADRVKGNAMNPNVGDAPRDGNQPMAVRFAAEDMWDAYAHGVYLYETLKERKGSLSGRMRFDVCPGSSVEIILTEEKYVAQQVPASDEQSLYGMVTKVSIIYDAEAAQGQTNIELGYLRDTIENDTDLGTDEHPLYGTVFIGAPLCKEQPIPGVEVPEEEEEEEED